MKHDVLVVGSGMYGATAARELAEAGKTVLVMEKRDYIGGMTHDEIRDGIRVSLHGGHIFHTNDRRQWEYVQRFADWTPLYPIVRAMAKGKLYSFPINLMTLQQVFGVNAITPETAKTLIGRMQQPQLIGDNIQDWCIANIGAELYDLFIYGYTRKMWGKDGSQIPAAIVRRLPVQFSWADCYSDHTYQGVPVHGFTNYIANVLNHPRIRVEVGQDYLAKRAYWDNRAETVIYTGPVDALCGEAVGKLEYRSTRWEFERHNIPDYQGCQAVNYCDVDEPKLRTIEYKHFWPAQTSHTIVGHEYSADVKETGEPYYPVNNPANQKIYEMYRQYATSQRNMVVGGRLGSYKYLDIHQVLAAAQKQVKELLA